MKKKKAPIKVVIVGAGGFAREVLWTINDCNKKEKKYNFQGFIDENKSLHGKKIAEFPVLGGMEWFSTKSAKNVHCVIAIGDCTSRKKVVNAIEKIGVQFTTIIHPSVMYSNTIKFGKGTIVQAGCIITVDTKIGNHVHININSTVGHDCIINDFVTINPGVEVNGRTNIEAGAYIGTGVTMKQQINIGKWSIVGAGAALIDDVPDNSLVAGVPGKVKKILK